MVEVGQLERGAASDGLSSDARGRTGSASSHCFWRRVDIVRLGCVGRRRGREGRGRGGTPVSSLDWNNWRVAGRRQKGGSSWRPCSLAYSEGEARSRLHRVFTCQTTSLLSCRNSHTLKAEGNTTWDKDGSRTVEHGLQVWPVLVADNGNLADDLADLVEISLGEDDVARGPVLVEVLDALRAGDGQDEVGPVYLCAPRERELARGDALLRGELLDSCGRKQT